MAKTPGTIVIGIGSILRTDDATGVRVVEQLEKQGVPEKVRLLFGELAGLDLIKYFDYEKVILVDCATMKTPPGTIKVFSPDDVIFSEIKGSVSTHNMGLQETIKLAKEMKEDTDITIVGIEPFNTKFGLELSPEMKKVIPEAVETVKRLL